MYRNLFITSLLIGAASQVFAASNRPSGYETICKIGNTCSVSQSTNVAFGASGKFVYKVLNGSFSCSVSTFGSDPNPEKSVKECSIPKDGSSGGGNSGGGDSGGGDSGGGDSGSGSSNKCGSGGGATVCLSASGNSSNISLSWSVSGSITDAQVYRDTDSNPSGRTRIASVGPSARSYTDSSASSGTTYYYWIKFRAGDYHNSGAASAQRGSGGGDSGGGDSGGGDSGGGDSGGGGRGSSCSSSGSESVSSTIKVSGTFDGKCKTYNPTSALGDGSQSESQKPVFRIEGGTIKNVIIGNNGADGIHFYGGGSANNIIWKNVGEDALTVKSKGNVTVSNVEGYDGSDKFIQVNAETNLKVSNCIVKNMGKFLRQNGGKTFPISVSVNNCAISNMKEGVFRSDSSNSTAKISNSSLSNAGKLCIGNWKSCGSN